MYNHATNAGNEADRWKHNMLLDVVDDIKPRVYFEPFCGYPYYKKHITVLLSSWIKVMSKSDCSATLCDINKDIAKHITKFTDVNFSVRDGWQAIKTEVNWDLCFIDPPYVNFKEDMSQLTLILNDPKIIKPLIAWFPIFKEEFNQKCEFTLPTVEHMFDEGRLMGCGMVFKNLTPIIKEEK